MSMVAHSMGYAYALGMINTIKDKINLGRFYIIAPENAEAGGLDDWRDFQSVWQYGSDENTEPIEKQDGVAPQTAVSGLTEIRNKSGRVYIPTDGSVPRGFVSSHSIGNYGWIFKKKKVMVFHGKNKFLVF